MATAAIAHDWFVVEGGAERVALELADLLPTASIYTSFFDPSAFPGVNETRVHSWPLQRIIGPTRHFRSFLPLYPLYFGGLDLRRYDLVVSSSVAFTHAVRTARGAIHLSYVHTPLRYAWDLDAYLRRSSFSVPARLGGRLLRPWLQRWDRSTANRPDVLVANSEAVRQRIQRFWNRDAEVIHPPVDVDAIQLSTRDDGFLLIAARMLAYRRLDLAVAAATRLNRQLVLVGDGPERARLQSIAGPSVRFVGRVDRPVLIDLIQRSHAYLVPGEEDFGIAPVEAMAAGKPVVALARGGVTETVLNGRTGILFEEPTIEALSHAIEALDTVPFDGSTIRAQAERFSPHVFRAKFRSVLERLGVDPAGGPR
ncbi:MAG TPA: glycosyltransferase [Candidatus Limnocylindrales bacterium]|nr:glycosyltransferase [Candidatus Limnocylindrales bacterium]